MIALVLSAGFGTRFRPATLTKPKPLIPFLGRPILYHVFDHLISEGVHRFVVNTHHLGDVLEKTVGPEYRARAVSYSFEPDILGTAGGIKRAFTRGLLGEGGFLVVNGDVFTTLPMTPLIKRLEEKQPKALGVLAVIPNENPGTETPLWADEKGALCAVGGNRPFPDASGPWLFTGVHAASASLPCEIPDGFSELARDVLKPSCMRENGRFFLMDFLTPRDGFWFDLGSPERLEKAASVLAAAGVASLPPGQGEAAGDGEPQTGFTA